VERRARTPVTPPFYTDLPLCIPDHSRESNDGIVGDP
jgi:hypothetical protein